MIFVWNAKADCLREGLARDAKLHAQWNKENPGDTDYFLQILNARDGTVAGGIIVRTGKSSFHLENQEAAGDWLVVTDNRNRVLLYSISTGEQKAKWFGYRPQISAMATGYAWRTGEGTYPFMTCARSSRQMNSLLQSASPGLFFGRRQAAFCARE
jgi:hypothetical protein